MNQINTQTKQCDTMPQGLQPPEEGCNEGRTLEKGPLKLRLES